MLVNAFLKEAQLQKALYKVWYDPDYQWYFADPAHYPFNLNHDTGDETARCFASVNKAGKVIGMMGYGVYALARYATHFYAIRFPGGDRLTFGRDLHQVVDDIFNVFNMNRLGFAVVMGNPAEKMYNRYLDAMGGSVVGIEKEVALDMAGNLCDRKIYEVLRKDYLAAQERPKAG